MTPSAGSDRLALNRPALNRPSENPAQPPSIAVVMPAYNEAARIEATLEAIARHGVSARRSVPVFLADDGSSDETSAIASATAERLGLDLSTLRLPHRGKARTVRDGMLTAAGRSDADYLLMLDADNEISMSHVDDVAWTGDIDTIYIARRVRETGGRLGATPPAFRRFMSIAMRVAARLLLGLPYSDTQCGFKLFPRHLAVELFSQQRSSSWVFDAEILAVARAWRIPIREVPVVWQPRGESRVGSGAAISSALGLLGIAIRRWVGRYRRVGPPPRG